MKAFLVVAAVLITAQARPETNLLSNIGSPGGKVIGNTVNANSGGGGEAPAPPAPPAPTPPDSGSVVFDATAPLAAEPRLRIIPSKRVGSGSSAVAAAGVSSAAASADSSGADSVVVSDVGRTSGVADLAAGGGGAAGVDSSQATALSQSQNNGVEVKGPTMIVTK